MNKITYRYKSAFVSLFTSRLIKCQDNNLYLNDEILCSLDNLIKIQSNSVIC
jgi:hypothetical protein